MNRKDAFRLLKEHLYSIAAEDSDAIESCWVFRMQPDNIGIQKDDVESLP